jgi:Rieske Fe-S protein
MKKNLLRRSSLREIQGWQITTFMGGQPAKTPQPNRRGFLRETCAIVIGAITGLVPFVAGLSVFFDPLRRKSQTNAAIRVAMLDALPNDGVPRKFPVIASRTDAWNQFSEVPIGAVYLRRTGEKSIQAFNVVCPHAGCFVDFLDEKKSFLCPCHLSTFTLDGKIDNPESPSPRGLDTLDVEIRNQKEVWVKFQNFQAGHAEKIPVA